MPVTIQQAVHNAYDSLAELATIQQVVQHADNSLAEAATIQQVVQYVDGSLAEPSTIQQVSNTQTAILQSWLLSVLFTRCPHSHRLPRHTFFANIFAKAKNFAKPFYSVHMGPR